MTEFTLGFNIQTVLFVICIISSICLLIFGGYLIEKRFCNKKSEETKKLAEITKPAVTTKPAEITKWTPESYNKLKDKINFEINSSNGKSVENFSESVNTEVSDCVTNRFALEYNDPKFIDDSDPKFIDDSEFKSIVQRLKRFCEDAFEKKRNDENFPDPDPGPPFWTDELIEKVKSNIKKSLENQQMPPNSDQLDCIMKNIVERTKFPKNLQQLNDKQKGEIMEVCKYNPSSMGPTIGSPTLTMGPTIGSPTLTMGPTTRLPAVTKVNDANTLADQMYNVLKTGYDNFVTAMNKNKIAEDRFNRHNTICVSRPDACAYMHREALDAYNKVKNLHHLFYEEVMRDYIQKINEQINKFQNEGPDYVSSTAFIQRTLENMKTLEIDFTDAKVYLETVDNKNKMFAPEEVASAKAVAKEIANTTAALVDKVNVVFTLADQIYSDVETANNNTNIAIKNFNEASDNYTYCSENSPFRYIRNACDTRLSEKQSKEMMMNAEKQNLENAKMNYIQKVNEQINKFQNEGPDYVSSIAFIQRSLENMETLGIDISSLKDKETSLTAVAPKEVAAVKAASSKIAVIVADANKIANEIFDRLNFTFIDINNGYSGDNAYKDKFDYIEKVNQQITKFQDSISRNAFIKRTSELKKILEQKLP